MTNLNFTVERNPRPATGAQREAVLANPAFGKNFTDHMITIEWSEDQGWHDARVRPYGSIPMDPATTVFHYGQAIFEGIKAYRQPDGSIATFRPEENAERMQRSAERMAMPQLPIADFLESLRQLVDIDQEWVPEAGGEAALYLRPFM
ncbi:MAG TPA: branched chain amino acid aminotransferase, partial [Corynebacterium sp.]|nr:branched chain amino acid aminotransferase [Corynebacterium sp.]